MGIGRPLTRKTSLDKFVRMVRILDAHIPTETPTAIIPVTSLKGFKGFKIQGVTNNKPWSVELYGGNFYLVKVFGLEPIDSRMPLHVLNFLRAKLL